MIIQCFKQQKKEYFRRKMENGIQPQVVAPSAGLMMSLSGGLRVHLLSVSLLWSGGVITSTTASSQHACLWVYLAIFTDVPSLASRTQGVKYVCALPWETCCHRGFLFTGNGRLVQRHQGSQVPLPAGGLPRGQRRGGEEDVGAVVELVVGETGDVCAETAMAFLKAPVCWKAIRLQIMSMPSFLTSFFCCFVLLQLVPKLTRNFMKEGFMEKTGPKVCTMVLLWGTFCN